MTEQLKTYPATPSTKAIARASSLAAALAISGYFAQRNYDAVIQFFLNVASSCCNIYHAGLAGVVSFINGLFPYQDLSASILSLFLIFLLGLVSRVGYVSRRVMMTSPPKEAEMLTEMSVTPYGVVFVCSIAAVTVLEALSLHYTKQEGISQEWSTAIGVCLMTLGLGFLQTVCYFGAMAFLREKFIDTSQLNWLTDMRMYIVGSIWILGMPGFSALNVGLFAALFVLSGTLEPLGDVTQWFSPESLLDTDEEKDKKD